MNSEKQRQQHNRDIEEKESEMEEVRAAAQKRVRVVPFKKIPMGPPENFTSQSNPHPWIF